MGTTPPDLPIREAYDNAVPAKCGAPLRAVYKRPGTCEVRNGLGDYVAREGSGPITALRLERGATRHR